MGCPLDPDTGRFMSTATPEIDAEICELYVQLGMSFRQIGRRIGRSNTFIGRRLREMNVQIRPRGGGHPQHFILDYRLVDLAVRLYKRDWSMREISDVMGCGIATTHRRLHMAGADVRTRSEGQRAKYRRQRENQSHQEAA